MDNAKADIKEDIKEAEMDVAFADRRCKCLAEDLIVLPTSARTYPARRAELTAAQIKRGEAMDRLGALRAAELAQMRKPTPCTIYVYGSAETAV